MIQIVHKKEEANCITHNGTMHADEIFATAFLDLYLKDLKVFRTSKIDPSTVKQDTFIYDIGLGEYDHHQIDALKRENGIVYSSFGLLWKKFGISFLEKIKVPFPEEVFLGIDKDLVEEIDAEDNGFFPTIEASYRVKTLNGLFKIFNPSYQSNQTEDSQFILAVSVAKTILEQEITYIQGKVLANKKINELIENTSVGTKYLVLEEYLPYEDILLSNSKCDSILFVAYPSNRGGYAIKTVPISMKNRTARLEFPSEWAGLNEKELEKVSGISGLKFCHRGRFLVTCDSLDSAYQVLKFMCSK